MKDMPEKAELLLPMGMKPVYWCMCKGRLLHRATSKTLKHWIYIVNAAGSSEPEKSTELIAGSR